MQGILNYFNVVALSQSCDYCKVHCAPYLDRVFERHGWDKLSNESNQRPTPISSDPAFIKELETTSDPEDDAEHRKLEKEMGFSYCATVGELVYTLITCRPDISFATIKLSQYSAKPARCHYVAIKNCFRYLYATKYEGLIRIGKNIHTMSFLIFLFRCRSHLNTNGRSTLMAPYTRCRSMVLLTVIGSLTPRIASQSVACFI